MAHLGRRLKDSVSVIDLSQLPSASPSSFYHLNHSDNTITIRTQKRQYVILTHRQCIIWGVIRTGGQACMHRKRRSRPEPYCTGR